MLSGIESVFSNVWGIVAIVLLFGGSIFVHELGHFLAAKRRGLVIERFSIGFGPKMFGWTRDGIDYRVSWLPLGGYVALPQLADMKGIEGQGHEDTNDLPPIGYASKMIVAVMGAIFNILFAFLLAIVIWLVGYPVSTLEQSTTIGYVQEELTLADGSVVPTPAKREGLRMGDKILEIDGAKIRDWTHLKQSLIAGTGAESDGRRIANIKLLRDGKEITLRMHPEISGDTGFRHLGIGPSTTVIVGSLYSDPNAPVRLAGIEPGDELLSIDGAKLYSIDQLRLILSEKVDDTVPITYRSEGETKTANVAVQRVAITEQGDTVASIGIERFSFDRYPINPSPFEQVQHHIAVTFSTLKALFHPDSDVGIQHMSGPPGIARVLYATSKVDIRIALWFTVLININLAIFNLLPIPVLDGGHMLFATISKLRQKPLPPNIIASVQGTFMVLLFGLMLYVSGNDIARMFGESDGAANQIELIEPTFAPRATKATDG